MGGGSLDRSERRVRAVTRTAAGGLPAPAGRALRRRSCLVLTDAGRAAVAEAHRTRQSFYGRVPDGWSADEMHRFAALLAKFVDRLDEEARAE
ncbi:hypothetical protein [Streptomyces sp. NPDC006274]|uniref:hypothetical protein n=1 Tax=unclassified Streptomyces TaxID=2593676 RepID=UPI0033AFD38C